MKRVGRFSRALLPWACLATTVLTGADDPPAPTFANVTVHDPSIVWDAATSRFWIFGSHMASAYTSDLIAWTQYTTGPETPNPLARANAPRTEFAACLAYAQSTTFWAPDVIKLGDGKYYFYYCSCQGSMPLSALGQARADTVNGPYSNVTLLLRSLGTTPTVSPYNATTMPNVVDPNVFFDQEGTLWMLYGSYSGGIFILRLDSTVGSATIGQPLSGQGYGTKIMGGYHANIEGGYVIYSPESEYYYLFVSFGGLAADGGYNLRVFRSRTANGPYFDAAGHNMATTAITNNAWSTIEPYGVKVMGNFQFQTVAGETGTLNPGYVSPGHCSVYYDTTADKYFLVFHTRFVGQGEFHQVRVHQMFVNADGWFVVAPHRYANETIAPTDAGRVVGTYKFINHGKDITATVKYSTTITLAADGTVSGSATGTWQLSGDYDATLVLDGVTYRGVFVRQWDEDRSRWVLTFTAADGANGTCIWGSKAAINTAPGFVASPAGTTVAAGTSVTLSALASGDPAPTYQWRKDNVDIDGATGPTLTLGKVRAGDAASYSVVATNDAGSTTSTAAAVTVDVPPVISVHPASITQPAGTSANLGVTASGTGAITYQWYKDDVAIAGATTSTLDFASLSGGDAGNYVVTVTDDVATTTSRLARIVVAAPVPGRIVNMSVRSTAGRNGQPLIVGFVMAGGSKDILIRGIGPELAAYDVDGVMSDPRLEMHGDVNGADTIFATNDNWGDDGAAATLTTEFNRLGAFPLSDPASKDAALLTAIDGLRSVHVNSTTPGESGIVLVEGYDAGDGNTPRLVNISARNYAGQGFDTLIAGFIISGNEPRRFLIRGVGPTLEDFHVSGVLSDPRLEVHTDIAGVDRTIAINDDWADEPNVAAMSNVASAFPLQDGSTDAAIVMTLPAGSYTALVSGFGNVTGEALVEVYELP